jgi:phosphoribosylformylglycinamidine cyclo-ligase
MKKLISEKITYKQSGVNIDAGNESVKRIRAHVQTTFGPEVLADIGLFGGLFDISRVKSSEPVLVASADGVGTKLKVAIAMRQHDTIGIDLVNHCINDILVQGARPLFFLDYFAAGKLSPRIVEEVVKGMASACRRAGCALIGGETAEMPDVYKKEEYDLAGFIVGLVDKKKIIDGKKIKPGDVLIGLASSGLHTNGYSLARNIFFNKMKLKPNSFVRGLGKTIGEELLAAHRCYSQSVLPLLDRFQINGMAHITGGGLLENIPRILADGCQAYVRKGSWQIPKIFELIQEKGKLSDKEAYRTLNMGIGLVLIVHPKDVKMVLRSLNVTERCYVIGEIIKGENKVKIS